MDIRKVKKLIEMLEESQIAEIEIHEGEESVRISRHSVVGAAPAQTVIQVPESNAAPSSIVVSETSQSEATDETEPEGNIVRAPMVGILYEAPAPGKPSFVELGQTVKKGDVLCIIEAMKIMNQVESEISGVVSKIMAENGEPVEYGQPLFIIREE